MKTLTNSGMFFSSTICGLLSTVEKRFCVFILTPKKHHLTSYMTSFSQRDRKNVYDAIDFYIFANEAFLTEPQKREFKELLSKIKIEYDKINENQLMVV